MIIIDVTKNDAKVTHTEKLTSGTVGLTCQFNFSKEWDELSKIAVCVCGSVVKDAIVDEKNTIVIPWEVLAKHGKYLDIGVYGSDGNGVRVIPTVYATVGAVCKGADPSGDESITPTPTIWEQILAFVKNVPYTIDAMGKAIFHGHSESASADEKGNTIHTHYTSVDDANNTFCNAIKGTAIGRDAVRLDGVSPIPHTVGVTLTPYNHIDQEIFFSSVHGYKIVGEVGKTYIFSCVFKEGANTYGSICETDESGTMISLPFDEETQSQMFTIQEGYTYVWDFTGATASDIYESVSMVLADIDISSVTLHKYGKNLYKYPGNKGGAQTFDIGLIEKPCTLSFTVSGTDSGTVQIKRKIDGVWTRIVTIALSGSLRIPTFVIDGVTNPFGEYQIATSTGTGKGYLATVQLELGTKATKYERYIEKKEWDGTPFAPTTTLVSDTKGVEISAEYNRDSNAVYQELVNAIINLGGTI